MPADRLFEMLAQAKAQPSRAYRSLEAALGALEAPVQGYLKGLELKNAINQNKFSDSPISEHFNNGEVPFNITPDTSVKGFTTLAPFSKPSSTMIASFVSPEQAKAMGADQNLIDSFAGKPIPRQVVQGNISSSNQKAANDVRQQIADAMKSRVGIMQKGQELSAQKAAMQYGGIGAQQGAIKESSMRLANIQRAKGLLSQINSQGGKANPQQRAELAMAAARTLNPSGVLTNEAINMIMPKSASGQFGNAMQYIQNAPYDTNFSEFANRFSDLLNREEKINQSIVSGASVFAEPFKKYGATIPQTPNGSTQNPNISTGVPQGQNNDPMGLFQ